MVVPLLECASHSELFSLLVHHGQRAWTTPYRRYGLLLLIDYLARNDSKEGVRLSQAVGRQYISKLEKFQPPGTVRTPLLLLCTIGLAERITKAVSGPHLKASAAYRLTEKSRKNMRHEAIELPRKLAEKFQNANSRLENGLNRRFSHRAGILASLRLCGFPAPARATIERMKENQNLRPSVERVVRAVDTGEHTVRIKERGQIITSLSSCPRELKPLLEMDRHSVAICDIAHAHHCFLPRILIDRIEYIQTDGAPQSVIAAHQAERTRLIEFLSTGDYYAKWCVNQDDPKERSEKKGLVNMLLNQPPSKCAGNALYRRMHATFPLTFRIIDDLKRCDHRNASKQTQHYTAEVIRLALLEMQAKAIPAIPDVDAIICQQRHRFAAAHALGAAMFSVSGGVHCKVDGLRYLPPEEIDELVRWNEEQPDEDKLSYDLWEEKRSARSCALTIYENRPGGVCPVRPRFSPHAFADADNALQSQFSNQETPSV